MSAAKTQVSVTVSKDGPYIVSGDAPLTKQTIVANADGESLQWQEGDAYDAPARYALCRCGHSHKAPFCDGSHAKIGFDGTETSERTRYSAQTTVFDGPVLALLDAKHLCADGRFCDPNGQSMGAGCPHGRSGNSLHISPPSASLSRGAPGRLRQSRRNNDRGAFTCLDRSDRRSGGALQRADLASRRHLADIGGRLSIRSPQPYDRLPMWRIAEQTILRWQPRLDQI